MDNVQKHNIYINIKSSQTFTSCLVKEYLNAPGPDALLCIRIDYETCFPNYINVYGASKRFTNIALR
jgi:hypothetical protein